MITPGPFAPKVTHHIAGAPTTDAHGNEVPAFTSVPIRAVAEGPGGSFETDTAATDLVTADRELLFADLPAISEYDEFTASDGRRYRVAAVLPYRSPFTGNAITQVNLRRIT